MNKTLQFCKENIINLIASALQLENLYVPKHLIKHILTGGSNKSVSNLETTIIDNTSQAYKFIEEIVDIPTDFNLICHFHKILSTNILHGTAVGKVRTVPVIVSGTKYVPQFPDVPTIKDTINQFTQEETLENIIKLMVFLMRTQMFEDCNKRTSVVTANHLLIKNDLGLIILPEEKSKMTEFKDKLMDFYETEDYDTVVQYIKDNFHHTSDSTIINSLKFD